MKNKFYHVAYFPEDRQKPYAVEQWDKDMDKVKYIKGEMEYFYGESPTYYPERYYVKVYANNEEESILKSEKLIKKYIKEQKNEI